MDFYSCEDSGEEAYILHGNGGESILRYKAQKESIPCDTKYATIKISTSLQTNSSQEALQRNLVQEMDTGDTKFSHQEPKSQIMVIG